MKTTTLATIALATIFGIFSPVPVEAQELAGPDLEAALEEIKQNCHPLKTLSLEFTEELREPGKSFVLEGTYRAKVDAMKNKAFIELIYPRPGDDVAETKHFSYIIDGVVTGYAIRNLPNGMHDLDNFRATIFREPVMPLPSAISHIMFYNSIILPQDAIFRPRLPLFVNGKVPYENPVFANITYNGEPALQILSSSAIKENQRKECFVFSKKTGSLLERKVYEGVKKDGTVVEEFLYSETYSDYFLHNGVLFPSTFVFAENSGSMRRKKIKKETARINEPIDESDFIPKIPAGMTVRDEINGIEYTTPIVGNLEAERALGKALDAYLEEAEKVTKPK